MQGFVAVGRRRDHGNPIRSPAAPEPTYGYNLAGDYPTTWPGPTSDDPAIDCTSFCNVQLEFWRWLGVESSQYDQAVIQVSTDRRRWFDVWRHDGSAVTDADWMNVVHDLAGHADGQPAVYIRWGLGPTDSVWSYCGWNLDVALVGDHVQRHVRCAPQLHAPGNRPDCTRTPNERLTNTTLPSSSWPPRRRPMRLRGRGGYAGLAPGERLRVLEFALYDAAEEVRGNGRIAPDSNRDGDGGPSHSHACHPGR